MITSSEAVGTALVDQFEAVDHEVPVPPFHVDCAARLQAIAAAITSSATKFLV
ncbi:MAG: hypothetical protein IPP14_07090 [Planctomycetes bacterium]|nr:hypothetical protein [Planctomycetota bacterium]